MEHINRIELQGRVGNIRTNEYNGSKVARFSLATEILYKTRDGSAVNEITWHNIVAWSNKDLPDPEVIVKGQPVYVSGRLRSVKYTNGEGQEKQFYEVLAGKVKLLSDDKAEQV
ncbi:MAG: single-stranded DNA-binding protein [Bacteroidales bacterium]|nr:single-stranded DNA-binding protein [Bacteroidales bacterium]MBQ6688488.1 single-stranded DNA-binding protein [Bacteroidales bacterium]